MNCVCGTPLAQSCRCFESRKFYELLGRNDFYDAALYAAALFHRRMDDRRGRVCEAVQHAIDARSIMDLGAIGDSPTIREFLSSEHLTLIASVLNGVRQNRRVAR